MKLSVSDKTPYVGQKVKLSWIVTGADSIKATGDWKGKLPKKGSKKVKIKDLGFHVFKLKATNVNGSDRAKVKVVAQRAPKNFTVTVPDDYLTVNTQVRVKAAGLDAKERFKVFLDDEMLGKGFADKRGDASALVRIPKDVKEGDHTLTVSGSNEDREGSVEVLRHRAQGARRRGQEEQGEAQRDPDRHRVGSGRGRDRDRRPTWARNSPRARPTRRRVRVHVRCRRPARDPDHGGRGRGAARNGEVTFKITGARAA